VTILYSSIVTVLCFAIAYPLAYYLSKVATSAVVPTLFLLLLIPLWVSEILRSFAWFIILALKGPLNYGLIGLGIIDQPVRWISGFRSIIIGLVYTYVLFMLFPVYNAVQSLDTNQIEAAEDLGSPWWRTHWRVILPHAKPGIASGAVTVFMLSAGSILVPTLLASTTSRWFTEIIQQWMFESQDWNTGSAYAFLLMLICTVFVTLVMRVFRVRLSDIAK
jgi:spermidine/putrescine transport system permease protein